MNCGRVLAKMPTPTNKYGNIIRYYKHTLLLLLAFSLYYCYYYYSYVYIYIIDVYGNGYRIYIYTETTVWYYLNGPCIREYIANTSIFVQTWWDSRPRFTALKSWVREVAAPSLWAGLYTPWSIRRYIYSHTWPSTKLQELGLSRGPTLYWLILVAKMELIAPNCGWT